VNDSDGDMDRDMSALSHKTWGLAAENTRGTSGELLGGGLGASPNHWMPVLFRHHMATDSLRSRHPLLLCTDLRWRRATAGSSLRSADSGVLDGDETVPLERPP